MTTLPAACPVAYRWVPWAVGAIAAAAAALYVVAARDASLHDYYTPAIVSMASDVRSFVFGAYDSAGWTAIDKIPGALWPQALSVAVLGASTWSVILPEVLATVATIVILYLAAARWRGRIAGLVTAATYATLPLVAALAQSNVPEVWFGFTLAVAAYLMVRALQSGSLGWLIGTGLALAAAFQVKMLEAWMLYPAVALAYLIAAPHPWTTRLWHTAVAGVISIAASLSWIILVTLTPAENRPWVGGTTDNSAWSMVFGYNGFGRVSGDDGSFVANFAGDPGWARLVGPQVSVDVAWLLPLAIAAIPIGLILSRRAGDTARLGGYLFLGMWLVPVVLVMTFSAGIHTFYVLAFAPALAMLVGGIVAEGWDTIDSRATRIGGGLLIAGSALWSAWLCVRADGASWLVAATVILAAIGVVLLASGRRAGLSTALAGLLLAPAVWTIGTLGPTNAINPSASSDTSLAAPPGGQNRPPTTGPGGPGDGAAPGGPRDAAAPGGLGDGAAPGGPGRAVSFDDADAIALGAWLESNSPSTDYLVAVEGSAAGDLVLAGVPGVIAVGGGFDGTLPTPTAQDLSDLVGSGALRFVLVSVDGSGPGRPTGGNTSRGQSDENPGGGTSAADTEVSAERTAWILESCSPVPDAPSALGTVYDCQTA